MKKRRFKKLIYTFFLVPAFAFVTACGNSVTQFGYAALIHSNFDQLGLNAHGVNSFFSNYNFDNLSFNGDYQADVKRIPQIRKNFAKSDPNITSFSSLAWDNFIYPNLIFMANLIQLASFGFVANKDNSGILQVNSAYSGKDQANKEESNKDLLNEFFYANANILNQSNNSGNMGQIKFGLTGIYLNFTKLTDDTKTTDASNPNNPFFPKNGDMLKTVLTKKQATGLSATYVPHYKTNIALEFSYWNPNPGANNHLLAAKDVAKYVSSFNAWNGTLPRNDHFYVSLNADFFFQLQYLCLIDSYKQYIDINKTRSEAQNSSSSNNNNDKKQTEEQFLESLCTGTKEIFWKAKDDKTTKEAPSEIALNINDISVKDEKGNVLTPMQFSIPANLLFEGKFTNNDNPNTLNKYFGFDIVSPSFPFTTANEQAQKNYDFLINSIITNTRKAFAINGGVGNSDITKYRNEFKGVLSLDNTLPFMLQKQQ